MKTNISDLKADTREFLIGKYNSFVGVLILYFVFTLAAEMIPVYLFSGSGLLNNILQIAVSFILSLFLSMASVGLIKATFNSVNGIRVTVGDLLFAYKYSADQFVIIQLLLTAIRIVCTIPLFILNIYVSDHEMTMIMYYGLYAGCAAISILFSMIFSLGLIWADYFLLEDLTLTAGAAIKKSLAFSKGRLFEMFKMKISFIGLYILSVCCFLIGFIYVKPYMEVTYVKYYLMNR